MFVNSSNVTNELISFKKQKALETSEQQFMLALITQNAFIITFLYIYFSIDDNTIGIIQNQ